MTSIGNENLIQSAQILRALTHPLRMKILHYIDQEQTVNVNKIYNTLKLEQSITSQHLKILRLNDLVIARKDGKCMYYSLNYDRIAMTVKAINTFIEEEKKEDQ